MNADLIPPDKCMLGQLLINEKLYIPDYQRPYKWQEKQVLDLITDIRRNLEANKAVYRIGTVVLYQRPDTHREIVDGQQRLVTLSILLYALGENNLQLLAEEFAHTVSATNIRYNYQLMRELVEVMPKPEQEKLKNYIQRHCEVVRIVLTDLSEAFQFFDAQNARGRSLEPYDLLKAFHLREMVMNTAAEKLQCTRTWEHAVESGMLGRIIGEKIYRIRKWSRGAKANQFSKDDIGEFKGINLTNARGYPFLKPYLITDASVQQYEQDKVMQQVAPGGHYPFQLTQVIINGKRFFELIDHYHRLHQTVFGPDNKCFYQFYKVQTGYELSWRTGDQYVRQLFEALVLTYADRFGREGFDQIYPWLYLWAYRLRLEKRSVRYASADVFVIDEPENNIFKKLGRAYDAGGAFSIKQKVKPRRWDFHVPAIEELFKTYGMMPPTTT